MSTPAQIRIPRAVYWIVATSFLMGAATKFWPGDTFFGPAYADKFAEWGFPEWFRFVVGGIELAGAVLLIVPRPRFRFIGAVALILLLVGANTTHIIADSEPYERVAAPTLLVVMVVFALANWPSDWRQLFNATARVT